MKFLKIRGTNVLENYEFFRKQVLKTIRFISNSGLDEFARGTPDLLCPCILIRQKLRLLLRPFGLSQCIKVRSCLWYCISENSRFILKIIGYNLILYIRAHETFLYVHKIKSPLIILSLNFDWPRARNLEAN